jgi:hypothetical protein
MATAAQRNLACGRCRAPFPETPEELSTLGACPACANPIRVTLFPAFGRTRSEAVLPEVVVAEGESACFYHPEKRAVTPCDGCGRFLCALCDLDLNGQHLCPSCLESGTKKRRIESLERSRTRWDLITGNMLLLAFLFFFIPFFSVIIALAVWAITIWFWKAPPSQVANSRLRQMILCGVALLLAAGNALVWFYAFTNQ